MIKIYKGDTATVFYYSFHKPNGDPYPITGATIETYFIRLSDNKHKKGLGTVEITNDLTGTAEYTVDEDDVNEEGNWSYYPIVTMAGKPQHFIPQFLEIEGLEVEVPAP